MDGEVLLSGNNSDHNKPAYSYMKMIQSQTPASNYTLDHLASCIPTNKQSRLITKQKAHKIRIIHIMPPEIIQTDKANFRNLVQRLTGRSLSALKTRNKKHQRPQVSSCNENMSYLLSFSGSSGSSNASSSNTNMSLDDPNHKQLNMDAKSDRNLLIGGFKSKVVKDEMMEQAAAGKEWGMMDELENGFCIDRFLELDNWLSQDTNSLPYFDSNLAIDHYG